jgi:hypothetical protein
VPRLGSRGEEVKPAVSGAPLLGMEKSAWIKIGEGVEGKESVVKKTGFQVTEFGVHLVT